MSEARPIAVGTLVRERYEVQSVLGRGGFGATYLVTDRDALNRRCALKELLPTREPDPKVHELFEREARTLSQLRHRGIPRLDAFFLEGGRYYLVQEFVPGRTLAAHLKEHGPLGQHEAARLAEAVLKLLAYLHEREPPVVHRDIKPSNLMVTDAGECFLIDFGAVREALQSSTGAGAPSTVVASSGYTPPEQLLGRAYPASDLYALGATLVHLLTGKHPLHWYNSRQGKWVYDRAVSLSRDFARVLERLLAESLADRYESAREVLRDIGEVSAPAVDGGSPGTPPVARGRPGTRTEVQSRAAGPKPSQGRPG